MEQIAQELPLAELRDQGEQHVNGAGGGTRNPHGPEGGTPRAYSAAPAGERGARGREGWRTA